MRELIASPDVVKPVANVSLYGGALISIISGFSLSDWGVILGILSVLAGLVMKWREHKLTIRKTNAEINEINKRVVFMERAGLTPVQYHQAPAELEAMKGPKDEQTA